MREAELAYLRDALGVESLPRSNRAGFRSLTLPDGRAYLLPARAQRAFANALDLYQTHRPRTRLIRSLLAAGGLLGWSQRLLPIENLTGLDSWKDFFANLFQRSDIELAITLGTPGPQRKPVIQILSARGERLGYAKVGWNKVTARLVGREADALETLKMHPTGFDTPQIIFAGPWRNKFLCVQSAPTGRASPASAKLSADFVQAVNDLAGLERREQEIENSRLWKNLDRRMEQPGDSTARPLLRQAAQSISTAMRGRTIPFHASHGDFTPWNAARLPHRLYLYDWESASFDRPAGYDLCHFLIRVHRLVKKSSPAAMYSSVLSSLQREPASRYWQHLGIKFEPAFLLLYLVDRLASAPEDIDDPGESHVLNRLAELCLAGLR